MNGHVCVAFTLVLFAYVLSAFFVKADLTTILRATFQPQFEWWSAYLAALVGILGTTISPYLFFWQAAEEVEEEHAKERSHCEIALRRPSRNCEERIPM